jgi:predicted amidohydrolase
MSPITVAAAAAHFRRDLEFDLSRVASIIQAARRGGAALLVLPDGTLGGYLGDLRNPRQDDLPPALCLDDPIFGRVAALAAELVVCLGFCEADGPRRYNSAVCLCGDGILGTHRKVHLPAGESDVYVPGDRFEAFDTPAGRVGMLIDYDKTFPEAARTLAVGGAQLLACLSAWPASVTDPARRLVKDRQARLFDLYDCARAAENQVVLVSANQTGSTGGLRFLGSAKVVGPGGEVLARTWSGAGLAMAEVDVTAELERARRVLHHITELRPRSYRLVPP